MTRTLLLIAACVATNGAGQLLLRLGAMGAAPVTAASALHLGTWIGLFSQWPIVAVNRVTGLLEFRIANQCFEPTRSKQRAARP